MARAQSHGNVGVQRVVGMALGDEVAMSNRRQVKQDVESMKWLTFRRLQIGALLGLVRVKWTWSGVIPT